MDLRTDETIDKDYKSRIIEFPEALVVPDNDAIALRALNLEMFQVKNLQFKALDAAMTVCNQF